MSSYQVPMRFQGHYVEGSSTYAQTSARTLVGVVVVFILLFFAGALIYNKTRETGTTNSHTVSSDVYREINTQVH